MNFSITFGDNHYFLNIFGSNSISFDARNFIISASSVPNYVNLGDPNHTTSVNYLNCVSPKASSVNDFINAVLALNTETIGNLNVSGVITTSNLTVSNVGSPINFNNNSNTMGYKQITPPSGSGSGNVYCIMPFQGQYYKKVIIFFDGYENTSTTAQTYPYPVEFTVTPASFSSASAPSVTISDTQITLPTSMTSAYYGFIILEGM